MSRGPDAATLVERALMAMAAAAGIALRVHAVETTPWASATFIGARHRLTVEAAASSALDCWLAALPEAEFRLRGHLVADALVATRRMAEDVVRSEIEILTIEDA
ncbi:hypothetical protein [Sphingomonas sp.]|uniref:hypothetical protein n=1 Tax=Sphingomonas sp. TaxID=28214 RepID=UPI001EC29A84|nr:hypothetical protein [Sphingomonas sp.]MBX3592980.1 hypothetical protein [Sphingomonas sp.]